MRKQASVHGFTLVELMVTIAVAAILLAIAAPSFQAFLMNNRMSSQADSFFTGLNYARNTALGGNVQTVVCPVGAPGSTTCGTDWSVGWMAVSDPTGTPTLLQSYTSVAGRPILSSTAGSVAFDSRGLASVQANFKICDYRGSSYARSLLTTATGFVQAGQKPGQAVWGGALSCP